MNDSFADHKEPEEIFLPLSEERYAQFYSIEMDNFEKDIHFYQKHCKKGSTVLELGCGTGRISRALTASGCSVIGLDLSLAMLQQAGNHTNKSPFYVCMDMTKMVLSTSFDHILIPYNTLNLLRDPAGITRCLQQVRTLIKPDASLLLQLHIPDKELIALNGHKRFQFQTFSLNNGQGKLIKETLRSFNSNTNEIRLEERYRARPAGNIRQREDFSHVLHLAGFPLQQWLNILQGNGFQQLSLFGDYDSRPFQAEQDSLLLIQAHLS